MQLASRHRSGLACALLVAMAAVLFACPGTTGAATRPDRGDVAPDGAGSTFEGEPIHLSAYSGKVIVLSFWASWCGPCRKELPILEGIQVTAGKERIQVIAINIESRDTFRRIAPLMSAVHMMVAHDTKREASAAYGVVGIPHMVIVGKDGRIIRINRGYNEDGVDRVVDDINLALSK